VRRRGESPVGWEERENGRPVMERSRKVKMKGEETRRRRRRRWEGGRGQEEPLEGLSLPAESEELT